MTSKLRRVAPLCSVIIPTYNHADYIERSISSALAQTLKEKEVIVVDDGSTDDTSERLRQYAGRVTCLQKENGGLGAARNTGIRMSRGTYLQFLDADDSIAPGKLQTHVSFLEAHPEVDVVYSDCRVVDSAGVEGPNASVPVDPGQDVVRELLRHNLMPVHASVVRRSAVVAVGMFDECRTAQEDWDLWLRLAIRGSRFRYVSGNVAFYDQAGSLMTTNAELMYRRTKHLLEKHEASPDLRQLGEDYLRSFVAHQSILLAIRAYNNRWWRRSRQHFWRATVSQPRVMGLRYLACLPKALIHELLDRLRGTRSFAPDE
jgi:glycosyltransferase involved in cell wall biosynthesis